VIKILAAEYAKKERHDLEGCHGFLLGALAKRAAHETQHPLKESRVYIRKASDRKIPFHSPING